PETAEANAKTGRMKLSTPLSTRLTENTREVVLRVPQDFDNGLPILEGQRRPVALATFPAGKHFPHPPIDRILRRRRQGIERVGVDQVAAGITGPRIPTGLLRSY